MPKKKARKKYPKLPSGFGTIRYLGAGRRNPYAVHPPASGLTLNGSPNRPAALCYVDSWIKGFTVLTAYKAGSYEPGMERTLELSEDSSLDSLAQRILSDYGTIRGVESKNAVRQKTFAEVYAEFWDWKFERDASRIYSRGTKDCIRAAFKNCSSVHNRPFCDLRHRDLQNIIDTTPLSYGSLEHIVNLLHQLYKYACIYELCDKDYSSYLKINRPDDVQSGIPFSEADLDVLWANRHDEIVEMILIMCYSGYRISAYKSMSVNLQERYFFGGVKTKAGKERTVPIHSAIFPLVAKRLGRCQSLLPLSIGGFRQKFYNTLESLGIVSVPTHTPHDCRHTFSWLCEKYGVNENDRKRMLGHSFGGDITNAVYGHRTVEELRSEIEKIRVVTNV